jgi:hypothetical protein
MAEGVAHEIDPGCRRDQVEVSHSQDTSAKVPGKPLPDHPAAQAGTAKSVIRSRRKRDRAGFDIDCSGQM